jgi:hypothetical protein
MRRAKPVEPRLPVKQSGRANPLSHAIGRVPFPPIWIDLGYDTGFPARNVSGSFPSSG